MNSKRAQKNNELSDICNYALHRSELGIIMGFMKTVVVGMSGGVDSSVAAYLLKEQGYNVVGVTMQIWQEEDACSIEANGGCCGLSAVEDARRVADELGIPFYVMNFRDEFRHHVIDYFIDEYFRGRTPNPCIACNRYVKWESLLKRSLSIGADYIATGHYARIEKLENGRYAICRSATLEKDQTYALYNLSQEQLAKTLMPCGDYSKEEIREMAGRIDLPIANKPDSQDICFVPDGDYASFIEREITERESIPNDMFTEEGKSKRDDENSLESESIKKNEYKKKSGPGNFITKQGDVVGEHKGIVHYTVGQRKGLGLSMGHPVFVLEIRPETNEVVIGTYEESLVDTLVADQINFMSIPDLTKPGRALAKIRYNHPGAWCIVEKTGADEITCRFEEPQRAVTPGQAVVLYDGNVVLGGGTIR